jgi:hypothetical protein
MTNQALVPADISDRYEVHEWRNGLAILTAEHPEEWTDILKVLRGFGWTKKGFDTRIVVDNVEHIAPTRKIGCYKNRVAVQMESDNKDDDLQHFDWPGRGLSNGFAPHMAKLRPRLDGSGRGPVFVFGIRKGAYVED